MSKRVGLTNGVGTAVDLTHRSGRRPGWPQPAKLETSLASMSLTPAARSIRCTFFRTNNEAVFVLPIQRKSRQSEPYVR